MISLEVNRVGGVGVLRTCTEDTRQVVIQWNSYVANMSLPPSMTYWVINETVIE